MITLLIPVTTLDYRMIWYLLLNVFGSLTPLLTMDAVITPLLVDIPGQQPLCRDSLQQVL